MTRSACTEVHDTNLLHHMVLTTFIDRAITKYMKMVYHNSHVLNFVLNATRFPQGPLHGIPCMH